MASLIYPAGDEQETLNLGLATWGMDEILAQNMILIDASAVHINGLVIPNLNFVNSPSVTFSVVGSNVSATSSGGGGVPGGSNGDIQYNNAGDFGGSAAQVNATGDSWFPGVVHMGNQSVFPTNPPGIEPDGWLYVNNTETRVSSSGNYIGTEFFYTINPVAPSNTNAYLGTLSVASTVGNAFSVAEVIAGFSEARIGGSGLVTIATAQENFAFSEGTALTGTLSGTTNYSYNLSGGVTTLRAVYAQSGNAGSGTVVSNYGLYVDSPLSTGSITNNYGIYVNDQTTGGANNPNPYSIYVVAGKSYLSGNILTTGIAWFPGVVSAGNATTFPTNPPGVEPNGWFTLNNTETRHAASTSYDGHSSVYTVAPSGTAASTQYKGFLLDVFIPATNTQPIGDVYGAQYNAQNSSPSGNVGNLVAFTASSFNLGAGTVGNMQGLQVNSINLGGSVAANYGAFFNDIGNDGAGTITNNYSVYISSPQTGGLNSNNYGIYIADQTTGGANNPNPFAIFVAGGKSSFGGPVIINSTLTLTAAAPTVAAAQVGLGSTTAATASAGGGQALPGTVLGYLVANVAGVTVKIPYYST